ncbi:alpha-galactosidase [Lacticaseibacillus rhamnosus]|nr:alpha-galactosidase [Lacticaseibacillus rhamnosus]RXS55435.1 alpha-galactosidase [Lacticaseibacillus rhamnosus]TLQ21792.1 alpha-galactosidase [Lacticaseibacillus rhamnosus]
MTRSPAQGSACKDLGRNGQKATITPKAAYTPIPNRAGSRSLIFGGGLYAGFARY